MHYLLSLCNAEVQGLSEVLVGRAHKAGPSQLAFEIVLSNLQSKAYHLHVLASLVALPQSKCNHYCGAPSSCWKFKRSLVEMIMVCCRKLKHFKFHMQQISERSKNHNLLSISKVQNLIFIYLIETQTQND